MPQAMPDTLARGHTNEFGVRIGPGSTRWWRALHRKLVFQRRADVLAAAIAPLLPERSLVLDIGCGDGSIARRLRATRPGIEVTGLEISPRPTCEIPCARFNGKTIPLQNDAVDASLLVDVIHHAEDPRGLLREAARVSRSLIIKDHLAQSSFDRCTLTFMDLVGNIPHGVAIGRTYFSASAWDDMFAAAGLAVIQRQDRLPLYPWPFSRIFGRRLHFLALAKKDRDT